MKYRHNVKVTKTVFNKAKRALGKGSTYEQVASDFGISKSTVGRIKVANSYEDYKTVVIKNAVVETPTPRPEKSESTPAIMRTLKSMKRELENLTEKVDKLLGL